MPKKKKKMLSASLFSNTLNVLAFMPQNALHYLHLPCDQDNSALFKLFLTEHVTGKLENGGSN